MRRSTSVCLLLATWFVISPARAETLHVSPQGRDTWSGRLDKPNAQNTDGPLASLQGARDAVRKLRAGKAQAEPVHVVFAAGTYGLTQPVSFTPEDSGTAASPTVFEAAPGAVPVFFGGRLIEGVQAAPDGRWTVDIPDVKAGKWAFEQLWINGKRATRARTPNQFYHYAESKLGVTNNPATGKPEDLSKIGFKFREGDMKKWDNPNDVVVVAYHSWEVSRHRVAAIDPDRRIAVFTGPATWAFFDWGTQRYHVENTPEALDAPGEWYLGRDGRLTYIPRPGETLAGSHVVAPVADSFLKFEGKPEAGQYVSNIEFHGLSFQYSQYVTEPQGHSDGQAANSIPATITADGAKSVHFDRCAIAHTGTHAIHFRRGCSDCQVTNSYLHDIGASAVRIGEDAIRANENEQTHHNIVDNTIVLEAGRLFPGAVGIWIGQSADNKVTHNEIADLFYTGVSVGWTWGYGPSLAARNTIDYNHIHHLGWGVLSDMGAVYTLGVSPGTTVSHNHAHDIYAYSYGGWGLYNDEGSSNIELKDNIVERTKTGGYHQHYGRENLIENNILAYAKEAQLQRTRVEDHLSFTFRHNLVVWDEGTLYNGNWHDGQVDLDHNLYWNYGAGGVTFEGKTLAERQNAGKEAGSVVADPKFTDPKAGNFTLPADSPALAIGFKPFDASTYGLRAADNPWTSEARNHVFPPLQIAPDAPPVDLVSSFEDDAPGSPAALGHAYLDGKGKGEAIRVTESVASDGHRSLEFVDAPGLEHGYNPHYVLMPNRKSGRAEASFDIRLESPNCFINHEWRDGASPYKVGPSFTIRGHSLELKGQKPIELPLGQWIHFDIVSGLGPQNDGTWTLAIRPQGQGTQLFEKLEFVTPGWTALDWFGYSNPGEEKSVWQLDNFSLREAR